MVNGWWQGLGQAGPTLTLSSDKDTRIKLWARVRSGDAPASDEYAYRVAKTAVEFRVVKPPRPYVGADGDRDRQDLHLQGDDQPAVQGDGRGGEGVLHPAERAAGGEATRRSTRRMRRT